MSSQSKHCYKCGEIIPHGHSMCRECYLVWRDKKYGTRQGITPIRRTFGRGGYREMRSYRGCDTWPRPRGRGRGFYPSYNAYGRGASSHGYQGPNYDPNFKRNFTPSWRGKLRWW